MSITRLTLKDVRFRWEVRARRPDGKTISRGFERLYDARRWQTEIYFLAGGDR